ncbi:hypothetical protein BD560DRAFT_467202 [Blakeslea trispora]|nr:hypothetical protein BD560DRAFT_467202 [Blakeslea trispora]
MFHKRIILTGLMTTFLGAHADLSGSASVTPEDYYGLGEEALRISYPACGMPYSELNLARITAVQAIDTANECGQCLKVTNLNTGEHIYVLAVDKGGRGLDISIPAFESLFGQKTDPSPAKWTNVKKSNCEGIYTPGQLNTRQGIHIKSSKQKNHRPSYHSRRKKNPIS